MVEALRLTAQKQFSQALTLRNEAFDQAEAHPGTINKQSFEWIADADSRLGPVLELIVNGRYYWVPFEQIRALRISPPEDLRDLVWLPVELDWANGTQTMGLIPTRYPGSETEEDGAVRLARTTRWDAVAPDLFCGVGQRMWATDQDDYSLLQTEEVIFDLKG